MDGGVVPFAFDGFSERCLGSAELIFLEINPAKTIEVRSVIRIFLQGLLNKGFRFVQANSQIAQHVTVIIQHRRVFRIYGEDFLELFLGLVEEFLAFVNRA